MMLMPQLQPLNKPHLFCSYQAAGALPLPALARKAGLARLSHSACQHIQDGVDLAGGGRADVLDCAAHAGGNALQRVLRASASQQCCCSCPYSRAW